MKGYFDMAVIENQTFDAERALYGIDGLLLKNCSFDGPADGESALKESRNVEAQHCFFNLRYPFWHDHGLTIRDCELTDKCRAALWYSGHIVIENTQLHGIKAGMQQRQDAGLRRRFPGIWLVCSGDRDGGL